MALDAICLQAILEELRPKLLGLRVDKVQQPSRDQLILLLRGNRLLLNAGANAPRIQLTELVRENPAEPPMFCMLLRKRMTGGRLAAIRQPGLERALYLDFDCVNELGDIVRLTLAVEIMGRHSNIILVENGQVVDAIKRVDWDMSSVRPVLPGLPYSPPPAAPGRLDLSQEEPAAFVTAVEKGKDDPLSKALLAVSHGLSPLLCREMAHLATRGQDTRAASLTAEDKQRLAFHLARLKAAVLGGENRKPYLLLHPDGAPLDFSFIPITQYGLSAVGREMASFSALLDAFYAQKDGVERMKQRSHDLLRVLTNAYERTSRKLAHQRQELEQSENREERRIFGDLINANLYAIEKGAPFADLVNYYDPDCATLRVPLDPALSAAQNAQKYYKEYRKAQTAERILAEQIARGEEELRYIDTVFDALSRASTVREIGELRQELAAGGYLRLQKSRQKPPAPLGPMEFCSDDGFTILVGRNNVQNDRLTLKTARGGDIWFHTKNIPGSHVVVLTQGETPPDRTLEQAAILAAFHSRAAGSVQVPVDYTAVRHVRKPAGAKPGMVIYDANQTAYVTPDESLVERLRKHKEDK